MIATVVVGLIFLAIMGFVIRPLAHFVVEDVGFGAGLLVLTGIIFGAIWLDRKERRATGLPPPNCEERLWGLGGLAMLLVLGVVWAVR